MLIFESTKMNNQGRGGRAGTIPQLTDESHLCDLNDEAFCASLGSFVPPIKQHHARLPGWRALLYDLIPLGFMERDGFFRVRKLPKNNSF